MRKPFVLIGFLMIYFTSVLSAQASFGGHPLGLSPKNIQTAIPTMSFQGLDMQKVKAEDEQSQGNRFAAPLAVNIDPSTDGHWSVTAAGISVWQLKIKVTDAKGLFVFYEDFNLEEGAKLYVYSPDGRQVLGAYTNESLLEGDLFMTGIIEGEEVVLEYQSPHISSRSPFHIWRIDVVYKNTGLEKGFPELGFGASSDCHDNVVCPTGDDWVAERNAVARIYLVVEEGIGYCSGTLLNNTAEDGRLLFLTAFHCMDGYTPIYNLWRFDFNYASETCENPVNEPSYISILGCNQLAGRRENDFLLLNLYPQVPDDLQLYFAGWNRQNINPQSGGVLSHPRGDIQKIAISSTESTIFPNSINWNGGLVITPAGHHFKTTYSDGTIEVGSSGAALFNEDHKVVGQLQGAGSNLNCDETFGFFGRLFLSWEGGNTPSTRLKDWLDPLNLSPNSIGALSPMRSPLILTEQGGIVPDVTVSFYVDNIFIGTTQSTSNGRIPIPDTLPLNGTLQIELSRQYDYNNGVTTSDLIKIQKHILGTELLEPLKMLAADVNNSNSISTLDMIRIRKLILTLNPNFGDGGLPSWQFVESPFLPSDPLQPWPAGERNNQFTFELFNGFQLPDFITVKTGDANGNANPLD